MKSIGVIGVGSIGRGIAHNIEKHGYNLVVYDTSIDRMKYFEGKVYLADGPADVIRHCECVLLSLPKSEIVEHTVEAFIAEGVKGKLIIDTSTSYPKILPRDRHHRYIAHTILFKSDCEHRLIKHRTKRIRNHTRICLHFSEERQPAIDRDFETANHAWYGGADKKLD